MLMIVHALWYQIFIQGLILYIKHTSVSMMLMYNVSTLIMIQLQGLYIKELFLK